VPNADMMRDFQLTHGVEGFWWFDRKRTNVSLGRGPVQIGRQSQHQRNYHFFYNCTESDQADGIGALKTVNSIVYRNRIN
jgi:hypothetical protein